MTTTDPIVIPRSDLPLVHAEELTTGTYVYLVNDEANPKLFVSGTTARIAREYAMKQLAIADFMDEIIAREAVAQEEKQLDAEGAALYAALHGLKPESWGAGDGHAKKHWRNVARKARELHGK